MSDAFITYLICALIISIPLLFYIRNLRKKEALAREAAMMREFRATAAGHFRVDGGKAL